MKRGDYYNEIDAHAAQWLRNLIAAGHLPAGDVDERSIADVQPDDLRGYRHCHFFAGIGGWAYAARLARWPDDLEVWTGSCPCQPFSVAGRKAGLDDARHLWPHQFRLIDACRPAVWMGEQVAAAIGMGWLDGVLADLESIHYTCGATVVPACAVNAPHRRDRVWIVADNAGGRRENALQYAAGCGSADGIRQAGIAGNDDACTLDRADVSCASEGRVQRGGELGGARGDPWALHSWITGHDGKARRFEPGIHLLVDGLSPWMAGQRASGQTASRQVALKGFGNAIVPQVAAEVMRAYLETRP